MVGAAPLSTYGLDDAVEQVARAAELLVAAQRRSRARRLLGPAADERRAMALALTIEADAALHAARVQLDRLLREAGLDAAAAPRPVIELR